jgi:predicted transglutaminase-like cysteine proteinase
MPLHLTPAEAAIGSPVTDTILRVEAMAANLTNLPQWSQMMSRHRTQASGGQGNIWTSAIDRFRSMTLGDAITAVNQFVNRATYVNDQQHWQRGDYWETPIELLTLGGDCEDFAIAKYLMLRELGVPATSMRILMLRGTDGDEDHAVLLVETASGAVILDNQRNQTYRYGNNTANHLAFAFNDQAMWLAFGH